MSYDGRSMSYHLHHTILWSQHVTSLISCHYINRYDHITDITLIMSFHVISCHIMSYHAISLISCHIMSPDVSTPILLCIEHVYQFYYVYPLDNWLYVDTNSKIMRHIALLCYVYQFLKESHR